jgi:glycosyltransferase involved in cell wall biosynthesis
MTTEPFFSLALPIRNGMPGLRRTIEALQRQTYKNFELIVQDGGSTDGSLDYIRSVDLPKVDIVSEPDSGVAQAYGRAFKRCTGPLVVPLACDEWLEDNAIETLVSWHREHPNAAFCYGGARMWKDGVVHSLFYPNGSGRGGFDLVKFMSVEHVPTVVGCFNKMVIGSDFYLDEGLATCPDFDLFIRLGIRFSDLEMVERDSIIFNTVVDRTSTTYRAESCAQMVHDKIYILERFFRQQGDSPLNRYLHAKCLSSLYASFAAHLRELAGETAEVQHYIMEAARYQPGSAKVAYLVATSVELVRDAATGQIFRRRRVQPSAPPSDALPVAGVSALAAVYRDEEAIAAGAAIAVEGSATRVTSGWAPWSHAARVPLRFGDDAGEDKWYWVELEVSLRCGEVGVAVLAQDGRLKGERLVRGGASSIRLQLPVEPPDAAVVIRNISVAGRSEIDLGDIRVLGVAKPGTDYVPQGVVPVREFVPAPARSDLFPSALAPA